MGKYIVTGGLGFIGYHLTRFILKQGYDVVIFDNQRNGDFCKNNQVKLRAEYGDRVTIYNVDICDLSAVPAIDGVEGIFHLAAVPRVQYSFDNPLVSNHANIGGTLSVLEYARRTKIERFVYASSSSVYGEQEKEIYVEDMTPNPGSPYALQKLVGEKYVKMYHDVYGMKTVSVRYFSVYGPNQDENHPYALLIPKLLTSVKRGSEFPLFGTGTNKRDFTYVGDIVWGTWLAMTATGDHWGEVINLGAGDPKSVLEIIMIIEEETGKKVDADIHEARVEPKVTYASNEKAIELLGWYPRVGIRNGIKKCIEDFEL